MIKVSRQFGTSKNKVVRPLPKNHGKTDKLLVLSSNANQSTSSLSLDFSFSGKEYLFMFLALLSSFTISSPGSFDRRLELLHQNNTVIYLRKITGVLADDSAMQRLINKAMKNMQKQSWNNFSQYYE